MTRTAILPDEFDYALVPATSAEPGAGVRIHDSLFAVQDDLVEDPVGTELKTGRQTLVDFYTVLASMDEIDVELLWSKVAADTAVFSFELRSGAGGHRFELRPVDIMIFDEDAKIVSLRAVFDPATDIKPIP